MKINRKSCFWLFLGLIAGILLSSVKEGEEGYGVHFPEAIEIPLLTVGAILLLCGWLLAQRREKQCSEIARQLYEGQEQLRQTLTGLEYASELTRSAFFRLSMVDWSIIACSRLFEQLWPVENGRTLAPEKVVYPEDLPEFQRHQRELSSGKTVTWNFRTCSDGKFRYLRLLASVDRDEQDEPCMIGVIQDVTEIAKSAADFKEQMDLWNAVIDALPAMIFAKDPDDNFRYVLSNRVFETSFGKRKEEVVGHTDYEILSDTLAEEAHQTDKRAMTAAESCEYRQIQEDHRNNQHHVQMLKKMFVSETGRRLLLGVGSDVTEMTLALEYQKVMNFSLNVFLQAEDIETSIRNVLEKLGEYTRAARVFIMKYDVANNRKECFAEYAQTGRELMFSAENDIAYNPDDPWFGKICRNEFVFLPDLESQDAKTELAGFHELFVSIGAHSLFGSGLLTDGRLWGDFALVYEDRCHHLNKWEELAFRNTKSLIELLLRRAQIQDNLKEALQDQQVLNSSMETLFLENDSERALNTLMRIVCEHFKASRCYIIDFNREQENCRCFAEYVRSGREYLSSQNAAFPVRKEEQWLTMFQAKESILIYDLADPEKAALLGPWQGFVKQFNMRSIFAAPIYLHGELWGDFGVIYEDEPCRQFNQRELDMLNAVVHLIEVIQERQKTHDRLAEAVRQAQAADRAKSYFIASVSHEIRTPLNAVIGFAELLKKGDVSPENQKDYVEAITFSSNSLLQLINDVLDLSKLEAEQMTLICEPVDFKALASDVMKIFSFRAKEKNLQLIVDIPELPMLELDQMRIRQILINLVGNAIKFTEQGSITIRAEFRENGDGTAFLGVHVIDTGIGIAKPDQAKLMRPFVQLSNLRGTNAGNNGTGLGLAISSRLLKVMGGEMTLESEPGKGSRFSAILPHVKIAQGNQALIKVSPDEKSPGELKRDLTLLLVDDVQMNLKVLEAMCRKLGMRCVLASSAQEALEKVKQEKFDAILTDMWMPQMNGEQLAQELRGDPRFATLPIIAVTADVEVKKDFSTENFTAILRKPVTLDKIQGILVETLS